MKDLQGAVALISGGASGIGLGIAQAFAREGMSIAIADIDEEALAEAAASLGADGATVLPICLDVRDRGAWETAVGRIESELGPLQVLCSNAGVAGSVLPIAATEWEGWRWTIDVNLHGSFHALRTCVPRMLEHGRESHVVCTASLGAFLVMPNNAAYSAAKAGVVAMCEALRMETAGSPLGVSVLCPGLVATRLLDNGRRLGPAVPLGAHDAAVEAAMEQGLEPIRVGEIVVTGIREGRFWLFTDPDARARMAERCAEVLEAM